MSNEIAPNPMHGAAYRVLLERVDIQGCSEQSKLDAIIEMLKIVRGWTVDQPYDVKTAYLWAAMKVEQDARSRLKLFDNSRSVFAAYDQIAKPPIPEPANEMPGRAPTPPTGSQS